VELSADVTSQNVIFFFFKKKKIERRFRSL
jgi:hypothetical protein